MKIRRNVVLLGMLILLCSFLTVTAVQAKPTRTVINFVYFLETSGEPARIWFSDEGMYQVRGTPHEGHIHTSDSDFSGELFYLGDLTLNLTTYEGRGGGLFEFSGEYLGEAASLTGKSHFKIRNFLITGTLLLHGSGSLEGLIKGTFEGPLGQPYYTAQIIIWT
ncbi:MAG: hypothetical protein ACTSP5_16000 [Candidatus Heimdallarchaeota archaeon]